MFNYDIIDHLFFKSKILYFSFFFLDILCHERKDTCINKIPQGWGSKNSFLI
jgi:hypothetical protein